uniref:Uncharacterized protein n=1 Tax=Spongospora subterranea TaxID=70186 RepID=A0A0H5QXZ3_9EUKA|eukprot:CRZ06790.1 hypothetical protein [Spongospora subterranea]
MTDFLGIALVLIIPFGYAGTTCGRSHGHNPESGSDPQWHVYLTAIVSSMLVPFVSFLGMLAVKFFRVNAKTSLPILVKFGAGTMISSALLGFLPEAFEVPHTESGLHSESGHTHGFNLIGFTVLSGVICALVFEVLVHSISSHEHGHAHGDGCKIDRSAKPFTESGDNELTVVASTPCDSTKLESMAWNILISDALHNIVDGLLIGVAFMSTISNGFQTTLLVILHELPQEVAELCILLHAGWPMRKAIIRNAGSTLTIVFGTIIGLTVGSAFSNVSKYFMAFVGGQFLYIALGQLLPSIPHETSRTIKIMSSVAFFFGILLFGVTAFIFPHSHV